MVSAGESKPVSCVPGCAAAGLQPEFTMRVKPCARLSSGRFFSVPDSLQEKVYANRKIRRPNKAGPALRDGFADGGKIIVPACRANNGVDAHGSKAANIFRSGVR